MDKSMKMQLTPRSEFDAECKSIEVEILNSSCTVDERLDEIACQIEELDSSIDKLTNHADKIDYAVAVSSGILTGLIDAFFVKETELQSIDDIVQDFAEHKGWSGDSNKTFQDYLEKKFHSSNDAAYQKGKDIIGRKIDVGGKTHRLDEIAHHPTPLGLMSSIIIRFLNATVYINKDGNKRIVSVDFSKKDFAIKLIPVAIAGIMMWLANSAEQYNEDAIDERIPRPIINIIKGLSAAPVLIEILKCADNWWGHLMSDVGTPAGIPGIFLSLLKEMSSLPIIKHTPFPQFVEKLYNNKELSLANELPVIQALSKQALPIIINEILVRTFYFVRHLLIEYKLHKKLERIDWKNTIPFGNRTIERMMTIASGTFCAIDTLDAVIEGAINSKANWVEFGRQVVVRLNFVGIGRFTVALGTDAVMGLSKDKKSRERMLLKAESLYLHEAKLFCGDKLMWTACKDANKSIDELYDAMQRMSVQITENVSAIQQSIQQVAALDESELEKNNQGLTKDILDIL